MYAHVDNKLVDRTRSALPPTGLLDNGDTILGLSTAAIEDQHACGWYEIADTPRPDDTPTTTYDRSLVYDPQAGTVTVVWTARAKTQAEIDADAENTAQQGRATRLDTAIAALHQWAADAAGTTITSTNAVAVVGVLTDRFGKLCEHLADLLEYQGLRTP